MSPQSRRHGEAGNVAPPNALFDEFLHAAREFRLTAYDAVYLEMALRQQLPLATLDRELRTAASKAGVEIVS